MKKIAWLLVIPVFLACLNILAGCGPVAEGDDPDGGIQEEGTLKVETDELWADPDSMKAIVISDLHYTEAQYNEPITLEEAAERVHLQVNYFCHIFKESTGMTYLQYLNDYRLGRIYQDLIETEVPLKSLLERHGFTNYKLFRRMFADHFGTTPGKLRKGVSGGRIR